MRNRHSVHGMNPFFTTLLLVTAILLLGLQGCVTTNKTAHPAVEPSAAYDQLYPYYVSACTVTQIQSKITGDGGSAGHAAMFLKGVCIDHSRGYPRLTLCDPNSVDLSSPESGTGVSVNKVFKSVNWMATPGSQLFYDGILDQGTVTEKAVEDTLSRANSEGLLEGIEIHEKYIPASATPDEAMSQIAKDSLSTDFALRFGRHAYCVQIPMGREQIGKVVDYLNELNDQYASGKTEYNWSGYSDNCSHAVHNSLASANVWKPQKVSTTKFKQLFNLSVPANEIIKLGLLVENFPLENFKKIYYDATRLRALLEENWLPARHGSLVKYLPIHYNNELYGTDARILLLELPLLRSKSKRFVKLFDAPHNIDVRENLLYYQERYRKILSERPSNWDQPSPFTNPYRDAQKKYYEYIEAQLEDVKQKLAQLAAM